MNRFLMFLTGLLVVVSSARSAPANSIDVIVIAYANPAFTPDGPAMWNALVVTAERADRNFRLRAILNPDSGPGRNEKVQQARFVEYFGANGSGGLASQFLDAGGQLAGYVSTLRAERPIGEVTEDIDDYLAGIYAGKISAIFLDDFYDAPSDITYYQSIYTYVQTQYPGIAVIGNAGNTGAINGLSTQQTSDLISPLEILVSHEMDVSNYGGMFVPLEDAELYQQSKFAHLIHDAGAWDQSLLDLTLSRYAGWVYFTPDNGKNPWDGFDTTFWNSFIDSVIAANVPPTPTVPIARKLLDGVEAAGSLADVGESDDVYYEFDPSPTTNLLKQKVEFILLAESQVTDPDCFSIVIEASMAGGPAGDVIRDVSLWNGQQQIWEPVDSRSSPNSETRIKVDPVGNPNRFIHPATGEVLIRMDWNSPIFAGTPFAWSIVLDQVVLEIE